MFELEQVFIELRDVLISESEVIFKFLAVIWAVWRMYMGGLRYLNGEREAIGRAMFQIGCGMGVIWLAPNFVYFIAQFFDALGKSVPTFGG